MKRKRATKAQVDTAHLTALLLGYNEYAKLCDRLGDKVYCRLMVEEAAKKLASAGHAVDLKRDPPILTLRERPPHIFLYEKDIEQMRSCVAEWDAKRIEKGDAGG